MLDMGRFHTRPHKTCIENPPTWSACERGFNLGPYGAPWGPKGEQKYPQNRFLRKELIFNLFQKSEMLLKPKYLDFGAMRNLGLLA